MTPHILLYVNISLNMKYMCNIPKTDVPFDVYSFILSSWQVRHSIPADWCQFGGLAGCSGAGRPAGGGRLPEISCRCIRMQETKFVYWQMIIKSDGYCFESACLNQHVLLVSGTNWRKRSICCTISMHVQTYPWIWSIWGIFRRLLRFLHFILISSETYHTCWSMA